MTTQPEPLSVEELTRLTELAEAATPGPWTAADEHALMGPGHGTAWCISRNRDDGSWWYDVAETHGSNDEADALWIVAAYSAVPRLVAENEQLRADVQRLSQALNADFDLVKTWPVPATTEQVVGLALRGARAEAELRALRAERDHLLVRVDHYARNSAGVAGGNLSGYTMAEVDAEIAERDAARAERDEALAERDALQAQLAAIREDRDEWRNAAHAARDHYEQSDALLAADKAESEAEIRRLTSIVRSVAALRDAWATGEGEIVMLTPVQELTKALAALGVDAAPPEPKMDDQSEDS